MSFQLSASPSSTSSPSASEPSGFRLSDRSKSRISELLPKYPNKMAACLPVLWIVQDEHGWISAAAERFVADRLDLPVSHVHGVVSFYTMFNRKPVGAHHIQVCTNIACMLRGGYDVLKAFETEIGIKSGETSADGKFTVQEAECLAACGTAPCVQINDVFLEPVSSGDVVDIVKDLRSSVGLKMTESTQEEGVS